MVSQSLQRTPSSACTWRDIQILASPYQEVRDVENAIVSCYASEFLEGAAARQKSSSSGARAFVNDNVVVIVDENVNLRAALRDAAVQMNSLETAAPPRAFLLHDDGVVMMKNKDKAKSTMPIASVLTMLGSALEGRHLHELPSQVVPPEAEPEGRLSHTVPIEAEPEGHLSQTVQIESEPDNRLTWRSSTQTLEDLWSFANTSPYEIPEELDDIKYGIVPTFAYRQMIEPENVSAERSSAAGIHLMMDSPLVDALYSYESRPAVVDENEGYVRFDDPPTVTDLGSAKTLSEEDEFIQFSVSGWWPYPTTTTTPCTTTTPASAATSVRAIQVTLPTTTTTTTTTATTTTTTTTACTTTTTTTPVPITSTTSTTVAVPTIQLALPSTIQLALPYMTVPTTTTTTTTTPATIPVTTTLPPTTTAGTIAYELEIPGSLNGTIILALPSDIAAWLNNNSSAPPKQKAKLLASLLAGDAHHKKLRGTTTSTAPITNLSLSDRFQQLRSALLNKAFALGREDYEDAGEGDSDTFLNRYLRSVGEDWFPSATESTEYVGEFATTMENMSTKTAWYEIPKSTLGKFFGVGLWDSAAAA